MTRIHILKQLWLFSLFIVCTESLIAQEEVSLLFVGDVMGHDGQIESARNSTINSFSYDDGFKFVRPIIQSYDFSIANLEITHAGEPFKGYPRFSSPPELSQCLVSSGFDIILTANNHSCDGGSKGVLGTLDVLDELGVKHTGTFRSKEERDTNYPLMIEKNGLKIAVLNYTYGTNGLSVDAPLIINYIDSNVIKQDVQVAKERGAEYIICTMHWGTEYQPLPNNYQKTYEAVCYRAGIDMVIGGHPHVLQPVEKKIVAGKERLTAWSLGNFVSNQRARYKNGGLMLTTTIARQNDKIVIKDASYYLCYVHVKDEGAIKPYYILPEFDYNSSRPGFLSSDDSAKMNQFFEDSRELFNVNNKDTDENRVSNNEEWTEYYKLMLGGFKAIKLATIDRDLLHMKGIEEDFNVLVDKKGNEHLIYRPVKADFDLTPEIKYMEFCLPNVDRCIVQFEGGLIKEIEK